MTSISYFLASLVVWWQQNRRALGGIFRSHKKGARLRAENGR
jgi:hypothetical protein